MCLHVELLLVHIKLALDELVIILQLLDAAIHELVLLHRITYVPLVVELLLWDIALKPIDT